ncbi:MAG: flagellar biosynthetic protein FliR [Anaerolineae bacterium]
MSETTVVSIQTLILIMFRLLAVFLLAPVISVRGVPTLMKIGFAFFLTMVLWPNASSELVTPLPLLVFAGVALRETFIGAIVGFVARLVTVAAQVAGSIMDLQVGFRVGSIINPLEALPSSVLEQLYFLLASLFFLVVRGDHALLLALSNTFVVIPAGTSLDMGGGAGWRLDALVGTVLVTGTSIALPVLAVNMVLDVVLAILSRAVPQIQVFFLGIPIKFGAGLAVLLITIPGSFHILRQLVGNMPQQIAWLLKAL